MFLDIDMQELGPCLDEARDALGISGEMAVIGIARSRVAPAERQAYGLAAEAGEYVLKYDRSGPRTGRLRREYATLAWLTKHSETGTAPRVVPPVYLSETGTFHITRFVEAPTAVEIVEAAEDAATVHDLFQAAGAWLSELHGTGPEETAAFGPAWHFKRLDTLTMGRPAAERSRARGYIQRLHAEAEGVRGENAARRFCHGDFQGDNLLIGASGAVGLDLAEARMKFAVYDVVDLFRMDWLHDQDSGGLDVTGVSHAAWEGFFSGYVRRLDSDILRFCLHARLLMDWLSITEHALAGDSAARTRFARLERRVAAAFGG